MSGCLCHLCCPENRGPQYGSASGGYVLTEPDWMPAKEELTALREVAEAARKFQHSGDCVSSFGSKYYRCDCWAKDLTEALQRLNEITEKSK